MCFVRFVPGQKAQDRLQTLEISRYILLNRFIGSTPFFFYDSMKKAARQTKNAPLNFKRGVPGKKRGIKEMDEKRFTASA
jgi:hypothetical protein